MWTAPVPIFEDEDEDALIGEFVKLSALYPNYDPIEIARHIFKDLRDPELRAGQAAMQWLKDITIKERIRKARRDGNIDDKPKLTKDQLQAKILATTEDTNLTAQEKKVMIEGYQAYAQNEGWLIKAVEAKVDDNRRFRVPIISQGIYPRD